MNEYTRVASCLSIMHRQILGFVLGGDILGPLNLGTQLVTSAQDSLKRLQNFNIPVPAFMTGPLDTLTNSIQSQIQNAMQAAAGK